MLKGIVFFAGNTFGAAMPGQVNFKKDNLR
jgi:hypothetical protein